MLADCVPERLDEVAAAPDVAVEVVDVADITEPAEGNAAGNGGAAWAQPVNKTAAAAARVTARRIALLVGCLPIVPPRSATSRERPGCLAGFT
jgi:hypothetical protein